MSNKVEALIPTKLRNFVNLKGIPSSKKVFNPGSIELNGTKIRISNSDTIETLAKKINAKKSVNKVEASVISTKSGSKLLLKSKNNAVNLIDLNGALENIHKKNDLGTNKNSLIQIIRDSLCKKPTDVTFNYKGKPAEQTASKSDKVSEYNKFQLSRYSTNNPENTHHVPVMVDKTSVSSSITRLMQSPYELINIDYENFLTIQGREIVETHLEQYRRSSTIQEPVLIDIDEEDFLTPSVRQLPSRVPVTNHPLMQEDSTIDQVPISNTPSTPTHHYTRLAIRQALNKLEETVGQFESPTARTHLLERFAQALNNNSTITSNDLRNASTREQLSTTISNKLIANRPSKPWWNPFAPFPPFGLTTLKQNEIANWVENLSV